MLKVAFGGYALLAPLTGVGQYSYQLANWLKKQPDLAIDFFYGNGFSPELQDKVLPGAGMLRKLARRFVPNAYAIRRALEQRHFSAGALRNQYDLYHEPNQIALDFRGPTVLTVHDLSWIRFPQTHPPERVRAMERYFEPSLRKASLLLTDSEFVKKELIEVFGVDPALVLPISLGLDPIFRPQDAAATHELLRKLDLVHGEYFLSVGTLEPRKNLQATIAAYANLSQAMRGRHPLVIVGMMGWRTTAIERLLEPLVRSGQARVLGYLKRADLAAVTAGAMSMVYPSLYEGFGLPPLEAMGCGVPPITSNVSSLPEVVADAGIQVAPGDIDALAQAMALLADDRGLRASLSAKAIARAAQFTWEKCAAETAAAYRRAAASTST